MSKHQTTYSITTLQSICSDRSAIATWVYFSSQTCCSPNLLLRNSFKKYPWLGLVKGVGGHPTYLLTYDYGGIATEKEGLIMIVG